MATDKHSGLLFSFEGIDGSGKSTQARLLTEALVASGYSVVSVREPGGTPLGESVRQILLSPTTVICSRAELFLFAAARAQLVESVIEPALAAGSHVIADRFVDSSEAYQGAGRRLSAEMSTPVSRLNEIATLGRYPDRTYLIRISANESQKRISGRGDSDRMESETESFKTAVVDAYQGIAERDHGRVFVLNGTDSPAVVHRAIRRDALRLIQEKRM